LSRFFGWSGSADFVTLRDKKSNLVKSNAVIIESPKTDSRIFAHTSWDALPVLAAIFHCVYVFGMFYLFPRAPLWMMLILGFVYSVSISWNINGFSHNFIHNPYFRSPLLNRLFSILESITVGLARFFTNAFTCSITREMLTGLMTAAKQLIGFRSTSMGMTVMRSTR
jgi:hypothetical protein